MSQYTNILNTETSKAWGPMQYDWYGKVRKMVPVQLWYMLHNNSGELVGGQISILVCRKPTFSLLRIKTFTCTHFQSLLNRLSLLTNASHTITECIMLPILVHQSLGPTHQSSELYCFAYTRRGHRSFSLNGSACPWTEKDKSFFLKACQVWRRWKPQRCHVAEVLRFQSVVPLFYC